MPLFGATFHEYFYGPWEVARGYLVEELEQLQANLEARLGDFTSATPGDILYGNSVGEWQALAIGTDHTILKSNGAAPFWGLVSLANNVAGTLPATNGGTGLTTYAIGDLLYADTTTTLARLADIATGNALISGGVGVAPSWGKIGLTTHVSGDLPFANLVQASAASRLVGRGSAAGAGDFQEITLGTGISLTGTVLSASGTAVAGYTHTQAVANATWTVSHTLGTRQLAITVTDGSDVVVIPSSITYTDVNTITITFSAAMAGKAYVVG